LSRLLRIVVDRCLRLCVSHLLCASRRHVEVEVVVEVVVVVVVVVERGAGVTALQKVQSLTLNTPDSSTKPFTAITTPIGLMNK